jgi:hypothetical protein
MRLGEVSLGLLDEVVFVLAGDRFTTRAVQMRLHLFTMAHTSLAANRSALPDHLEPLAAGHDPALAATVIDCGRIGTERDDVTGDAVASGGVVG